MWWIVVLILIPFVVIAIILITKHIKGDYGDGGGKQVGGGERIPFFAPRNDKAGMWGERIANYHLRPLLRSDEYLLANIIIPQNNGRKTEIDCVLITRKGLFCVEIKNWVGHVSGTDEDEYWIQSYDDPRKDDRKAKNPVIQNKWHCISIQRVLNNKYRADNIVIFARLEDGRYINSDCAFTIREFKKFYRNINTNRLNENQIRSIYESLKNYVATPEEIAKYREDIKRKYND